MDNNESKSDSTIPSYLYDGLCDYGELCSCSLHGRSYSYSNEILKWSKKDLEAYQKLLEDDAKSVYHESPPTSPFVEKEPTPMIIECMCDSPSELNPLTPTNVQKDEINLVVPDTTEDVITSRAKLNPKKRV